MHEIKINYKMADVTPTIPLKIFELSAGTPFKLTAFTVSSGDFTPLDQHVEHEYWLIVSGKGRVIYGDHEREVIRDDLIYFSSFTTHQVYNDEIENLEIISIYW